MNLKMWTNEIIPSECRCWDGDEKEILKKFMQKNKIKKCFFEMSGEAELQTIKQEDLLCCLFG